MFTHSSGFFLGFCFVFKVKFKYALNMYFQAPNSSRSAKRKRRKTTPRRQCGIRSFCEQIPSSRCVLNIIYKYILSGFVFFFHYEINDERVIHDANERCSRYFYILCL